MSRKRNKTKQPSIKRQHDEAYFQYQKKRAAINKRKMRGMWGLLADMILVPFGTALFMLFMYKVIIPNYGTEDKAVLEHIVRYTGRFSRWGRQYFYTFTVNGKTYERNSNIDADNPNYQLGDTVDIMYLEICPYFSMCTEKK